MNHSPRLLLPAAKAFPLNSILAYTLAKMCWRPIPTQDDLFASWRLGLGKFVEEQLDHFAVQSCQARPETLAACRMRRRIYPEPLVIGCDTGDWAFTFWRPNAPQNRLQAEACFIFASGFDLVVGMRLFHSIDWWLPFFAIST
jgi:hypothetical protein